MNENSPSDVAERIRSAGWRQGSVARPSDLEALRDAPKTASTWPIVITQSCDLLNHSLRNEPWVEVLYAHAAAPNLQLSGGRNPRRLQVPGTEGSKKVTLEINVHDRTRIRREIFAGLAPDSRRQLAPGALRLVSQWISKRYVRAAFPDEFNRRINTARKKIDRIFKRRGGSLLTAFIRLEPDAELDGDEDYLCAVALVHPHSELDMEALDQVGEDLERVIAKCPGIDLRGVVLRSDKEFTLHDISLMRRWDSLDQYSETEPGTVRPPDSIDQEAGEA